MLRLLAYVPMCLAGAGLATIYVNSDKLAKSAALAVVNKVAKGVDDAFDNMAKEYTQKPTEPSVAQKPTKEVIDEELVKPADMEKPETKREHTKEDVIETTFVRK